MRHMLFFGQMGGKGTRHLYGGHARRSAPTYRHTFFTARAYWKRSMPGCSKALISTREGCAFQYARAKKKIWTRGSDLFGFKFLEFQGSFVTRKCQNKGFMMYIYKCHDDWSPFLLLEIVWVPFYLPTFCAFARKVLPLTSLVDPFGISRFLDVEDCNPFLLLSDFPSCDPWS